MGVSIRFDQHGNLPVRGLAMTHVPHMFAHAPHMFAHAPHMWLVGPRPEAGGRICGGTGGWICGGKGGYDRLAEVS
jgi:hypothetical protein